MVVVDALSEGATGGDRGKNTGRAGLLPLSTFSFSSRALAACSSKILRSDSIVRNGCGLSDVDESDCEGSSSMGGGKRRGKCGDGGWLEDRDDDRWR